MRTAQGVRVHLSLVALAIVTVAAGCRQSPAQRTVTVTMHHISAEGVGAEAGTVTIAETKDGLILTPNLHGFRPGFHAFHAHEKPSCDPAIGESGKMESGRAAGPHYNGPGGQPMAMPDGMKMPVMLMRGDMPQLTAGADGTITTPVVKTGLSFDEILNRSIMMHPYGEDGQDPERPTDGSASIRIACGILPMTP